MSRLSPFSLIYSVTNERNAFYRHFICCQFHHSAIAFGFSVSPGDGTFLPHPQEYVPPLSPSSINHCFHKRLAEIVGLVFALCCVIWCIFMPRYDLLLPVSWWAFSSQCIWGTMFLTVTLQQVLLKRRQEVVIMLVFAALNICIVLFRPRRNKECLPAHLVVSCIWISIISDA